MLRSTPCLSALSRPAAFRGARIAVGSHGRRRGVERRGECDHRADPSDGPGDRTFITSSMVKRRLDARAAAGSACRASCSAMAMQALRGQAAPQEAYEAATLADMPDCIMVNRNAGAGTRILIDQLLGRCTSTAVTATSRARTMLLLLLFAQMPRRLGRRHRAGGEALRPRLFAAVAGTL